MKNKVISIFNALCLSLMLITTFIAHASTEYNDPNNSGSIELSDSVLITQYLNSGIDVTNREKIDFDINHVVSMADAYKVQLYTLSLLNPGNLNYPTNSTYNGYMTETYYIFNAQNGTFNNSYTLSNFNPIINNITEPECTDVVIGNDDEREPDWSKSGVVKIMDAYNYLGSGFVISPHIIATAAHCVYNKTNGSGESISGIKLFNNNGICTLTATPVECHVPVSYISFVQNYPSYLSPHDYALISVEEDLSNYMCFDLGVALNAAPTNHLSVTNAGFPQFVKGSLVNSSTQHTMYSSEGNLCNWSDYTNYNYYSQKKYNSDRQLYYSNDTSGGNSGGPVYFTEHVYDKNGNNHRVFYSVVAIHVGGDPNGYFNIGTRMNGELIRFYKGNPNVSW